MGRNVIQMRRPKKPGNTRGSYEENSLTPAIHGLAVLLGTRPRQFRHTSVPGSGEHGRLSPTTELHSGPIEPDARISGERLRPDHQGSELPPPRRLYHGGLSRD